MPYKKSTSSAADFVGKPQSGGSKQTAPEETAATPVVSETTNKSSSSVETDEGQDAKGTQTQSPASVQQAPSPMGNPVRSYPVNPLYPNHQGPTEEVQGILDVQPEGHGFLRPK